MQYLIIFLALCFPCTVLAWDDYTYGSKNDRIEELERQQRINQRKQSVDEATREYEKRQMEDRLDRMERAQRYNSASSPSYSSPEPYYYSPPKKKPPCLICDKKGNCKFAPGYFFNEADCEE